MAQLISGDSFKGAMKQAFAKGSDADKATIEDKRRGVLIQSSASAAAVLEPSAKLLVACLAVSLGVAVGAVLLDGVTVSRRSSRGRGRGRAAAGVCL